jgi:hypothetical protein
MKHLLILSMLTIALSLSASAQTPLDAINANKGIAQGGAVDLQHLNASLFNDPGMKNQPTSWLQTKNDTPVGYFLFNHKPPINQTMSDYIGLTPSTMTWKDAPIAPIGSV